MMDIREVMGHWFPVGSAGTMPGLVDLVGTAVAMPEFLEMIFFLQGVQYCHEELG